MRLLIVVTFVLSTCLKTFGQTDTIDYLSCGGGIPSGWSVYDSTGNDFFWQHTYSGIDAAWNPAVFTQMNSTSNSDGWLLFHSAYYNTDTTGGTLSEVVPSLLMNSTLTSTPFDFSSESTVLLSFEHWYFTLSGPFWGSLDFAVSNDSLNWTTYVLNTGSDSPLTGSQSQIENVMLDISNIAANEGQVWFRFHVNNLAWHFWMLDDILIARSISFASVDVNNELFEANVGPNPTTGKLNISLDKFRVGTSVKVYNFLGQTIFEEVYGGAKEIEVDFIGTPGIYLLEIKTDDGKSLKMKIVKK
jgi:hypothetical protein